MMPAGTYYIGDLCYCMPDEWDEFCEITIVDNRCVHGEFVMKDGRRFASYGTMYGDGCYPASNGASIGVDAGLIGCILMSDIVSVKPDYPAKVGTIVTFDEPFETYEDCGTITFGHITIQTGDTDYDEDDDYGRYLDEDE